MAKYTKHNSNYIRTERHQHLNDSSSIFERDWVTIGSQLSFGRAKESFTMMVILSLQEARHHFISKNIKQVLMWVLGLMMM